MKSFVCVVLLAVLAVVSCAPVGEQSRVVRSPQAGGFGFPAPMSGSAASAGSQSFNQGGFGPHGHGGLTGSAAHAGSQSFTQGGFGPHGHGGASGSAANAGAQSFSSGQGFPGFGQFGAGSANAGSQSFGK